MCPSPSKVKLVVLFVVAVGVLVKGRRVLVRADLNVPMKDGVITDTLRIERQAPTIRELAEEGMTCILVTHEMGFAREVADHIYFTDHGVIVEHGPPATFFTEARDERTQRFLSQVL